MNKLFYIAIFCLILFELANVYFIMPMPGSQELNSIDIAYFLYSNRWIFRIVSGVLILSAMINNLKYFSWVKIILLILIAILTYYINFKMSADHMFYQPNQLLLQGISDNKVELNRSIIGVEISGESKAYPIQYLGYHHQVRDTLGGKPILVTYCTVCRTGRVYEPLVNGKFEEFRLVGMDHFNAMFEDVSTKSWWRQSSGEAIVGKLKGHYLPEIFSQQMSLKDWLKLNPNSLVMQPDPKFQAKYDSLNQYEFGKGKSKLTRSDSISWNKKSWVIGITIDNHSKAFDWNELKKQKIINDFVGSTPVLLMLKEDNIGFQAFERKTDTSNYIILNDTLTDGFNSYNLKGEYMDKNSALPSKNLKPIQAYQEFWHSWNTFHMNTERYKIKEEKY